MPAPYSGRCACGAVTATISEEPVRVGQCWCRQCQRSASGGPTNNAIFATSSVQVEGELGRHSYRAESGNTVHQDFCPKCGTPVLGTTEMRPHFTGLRLGFLDEGHGLKPTVAIWLGEAPDWATIDPALERFDGQPPAPSPTDQDPSGTD